MQETDHAACFANPQNMADVCDIFFYLTSEWEKKNGENDDCLAELSPPGGQVTQYKRVWT